jgi:general secretion pathway protein G
MKCKITNRIQSGLFRAAVSNHDRSVVQRETSGFTLIELMLVLTILGILAGLVLPNLAHRSGEARITAAQTQISTFGNALDQFEVDCGYYPRSRDGLNDLIVQPRDAQNWHGPYLKSDTIPQDPWKAAYIYECPGKHNPSSYDIYSMGPDGRANTDDDICNWTVKR